MIVDVSKKILIVGLGLLGGSYARVLKRFGFQAYSGEHQGGTISFVPRMDCEEMADRLGRRGVAVRAGLHCAPLAHESAGTLQSGTVRISFGFDAENTQTQRLLSAVSKVRGRKS